MAGLGLKEQFSKNPGFKSWFELVLALPLLPTERIADMWDELSNENIPNADGIPRVPKKALQKLKKYVKKQWIVGKLDVLSVYGQAARTNNDSESYNSKWNNRVMVKNPNFWKLCERIHAAFIDVQKDMARLDTNQKITRPQKRKKVLNSECLRKAEAKLGTTYTSREFLSAVAYSFNTTNKNYFNELSEELEEDMSDENENADTNESSDSDDEQDAPELYQDESDDEIQLQPQVRIPTCVVCMDNPPNVVLVPCGHQNLCSPCANQWKDENGTCPTDRKEIVMIVPLIPL